jgi:hypothetical protein
MNNVHDSNGIIDSKSTAAMYGIYTVIGKKLNTSKLSLSEGKQN